MLTYSRKSVGNMTSLYTRQATGFVCASLLCGTIVIVAFDALFTRKSAFVQINCLINASLPLPNL